MNAMDIAVKSDAGSAPSRGQKKAGPVIGRKSVLVGLLATGFVATQAGKAFAATAAPAAVATAAPAAVVPVAVATWAPSQAYALGQQVITPSNDVATAAVAHTSSAAFATDTLKWTLSSSFVRSFGFCWTVDPRTIKSAIPMTAPNSTYYMRVQGSIVGANQYRIWVGTASGNISIANYANTGTGTTARPSGAPRNPTGSVACPAAGSGTLTPTGGGTFNIADGDWIGVSCNNNTASLGCGMDGAFSAMFAGLCLSDAAFPCTTPTATPTGASKPFYVAAESGVAVTPPPVIPPPAAAALLLDYQTGNFAQWNAQQLYRAAQQAIVTTPAHVRYTDTARFVVAPGDYTNGGTTEERSEVMASTAQTGNPAQGQTMWFAWSMYVPAGFQVDSDAESPVGNGWILCTQWHGTADSGGGPNIALGFTKGTATPRLTLDTNGGDMNQRSEWVQSTAFPLGQWVDFVVGLTWGTSSSVGRMTVKLNGTTWLNNAACANLYTGQSAYFKQGIYRSASNRTHTVYYTATRRGLTEASVAL
jgi:Polysaccharide lyase